MDPIVVGRPIVRGSCVTTHVRGGAAGRYLRGDRFWVQYEGLPDMEGMDPAITVLPALASLLPVAYALGIAVEVDSVDAQFAEAAGQLTDVYSAMYPSFRGEGFRLDGVRTNVSVPKGTGAMLLFSGGVDSTSSLIEHRDEIEDLLVVWGADIDVRDVKAWAQKRADVERNSQARTKTLIVARTNMQDVIDGLRLTRRFETDFVHANWWGAAQHGPALAGLAAPASVARGRERVYIAASHTSDCAMPWGSSPAVDNMIRWSGTQFVHDQYHLSRQAKLDQFVAPYVTAGGSIRLAVCYQRRPSRDSLNCGRCEKCLRTAIGLVAAGVVPQAVGVPLDSEGLRVAKRALSDGIWHTTETEKFRWTNIQSSISPDLQRLNVGPEVKDFMAWLRVTDLPIATPRPGIVSSLSSPFRYLAELLLRPLPYSVKRAVRRG